MAIQTYIWWTDGWVEERGVDKERSNSLSQVRHLYVVELGFHLRQPDSLIVLRP